MTAMIRTRAFIEGCLDENQTKEFAKMVERLKPDFRAWAEQQHVILESLPVWPSVLEETLDREPIVEGIVSEFGVCTGRSTNLIARKLAPRDVFGFDSFEGFPTDWIIGDRRVPKDIFAIDESKLSFESNVRLVKGFFDQSIPPFLREHPGPVSLIHVDCDTYDSTREILVNVRDRLQVGSIIVFDEILGDMGMENELLALWDQLVLHGFGIEWISRGGQSWTAETHRMFKELKKTNRKGMAKLVFYNLGSIFTVLRNKKKVEEARSAAAVRIACLP